MQGLTGVWVGRAQKLGRDRRPHLRAGSRATASRSTSTTDLAGFDLIVPCGIADRGVTSLATLLGRDVAMADVERSVVAHFAAVFEREAVEA